MPQITNWNYNIKKITSKQVIKIAFYVVIIISRKNRLQFESCEKIKLIMGISPKNKINYKRKNKIYLTIGYVISKNTQGEIFQIYKIK